MVSIQVSAHFSSGLHFHYLKRSVKPFHMSTWQLIVKRVDGGEANPYLLVRSFEMCGYKVK